MDSEDADTMTVECGDAPGSAGGVTGLGMLEMKRGLMRGLYGSGVRQSVSGSESLSELASKCAAVAVLDVLGAVG